MVDMTLPKRQSIARGDHLAKGLTKKKANPITSTSKAIDFFSVGESQANYHWVW
jgi:hypothetical protein